MITKAQITKRSSDEGLSARTVERDYVLAHVVAAVAMSEGVTNLVFKGGTALRMCHFKEYRYSADLDFSIVDGTLQDGLQAVHEAIKNVAGSISKINLTDDDPPRIAYIGPLDRERKLKLDIADDEFVVNTEHCFLLQRWPDLPEMAKVHVYTPLEIAAEKLRCVLQRLQCRDLFDLYMLFDEAGVDVKDAAALFEPKAKHRGFSPKMFSARYRERLAQYKKRWETELGEHLPETVPHFEKIERHVTRYLKRAGML
jgi:predicted nucleotidyltransferase component of viral defense system